MALLMVGLEPTTPTLSVVVLWPTELHKTTIISLALMQAYIRFTPLTDGQRFTCA